MRAAAADDSLAADDSRAAAADDSRAADDDATAAVDEEAAELRRLTAHAADLEAVALAAQERVAALRSEMEDALASSAAASRELERAQTAVQRETTRLARAARSKSSRRRGESPAGDIAAGGYSRGRPSNGWRHGDGAYVPEGLTPEQWREIQAKERGPTAGLGAWGSAGNPSAPPRGDLMATPSIWTDPSSFFNERNAAPPGPAQERAPNIFDVDDDEEEEADGD